jgi:hypothetical protein
LTLRYFTFVVGFLPLYPLKSGFYFDLTKITKFKYKGELYLTDRVYRKENENIKKYKIRLFENKELYNLTTQDIANLINKETGDTYGESTYRKWWRNYNEGYQDCINDNLDDKIFKEIEKQKVELQKEKIRFKDQKREYDNAVKKVARAEHILDEIHSVVDDINNIKPIHIEKHNTYNSDDKEGLLLCTDWHKGLFASNYWNTYNDEEFHKRIEKLTAKTIEYGLFNKINKLHIYLLGDLIHGIIRVNSRVTNTENVIKQTQIVAEVISNMLVEFAKVFPQVLVYNVVGNHARVSPSLEESIVEENFEYIIPWYLKARLSGINNIKIVSNEYDDEIIVGDICGHTVFGVHGDADKVNNVVQNLTLMIRKFPDAIVMGHMHHEMKDTVQGIEVIMSDSLCGVDSYAKKIRKIGNAGQTFIIFNKEQRECTYNIKVV